MIDHPAEAHHAEALDRVLVSVGLTYLQTKQNKQFIDYYALLLRWNARTNLTAVRDPDAILERHFLESIAVAQALPAGIATLLDYGSGAGFPGIPIAICRPEIAVTLAESQNKKQPSSRKPSGSPASPPASTRAARKPCPKLSAASPFAPSIAWRPQSNLPSALLPPTAGLPRSLPTPSSRKCSPPEAPTSPGPSR